MLPSLQEFSFAEIAQARRIRALLAVSLDLSLLCDCRCLYCGNEAGQPHPDELSWEELRRVAGEALALGVQHVCIIGAGEPTLDGRLLPLLRFLRPHCSHLDLFTNGSGLTRELCRELVRLEVKVVVKLESLDASVHDRLVGRPGACSAARDGLRRLREAGQPCSLIQTQSVITTLNIRGLPDLWRWSREQGYDPFVERLTPRGRARTSGLLPAPAQLRSLFLKLQELDRRCFGRDWPLRPVWAAAGCLRHYYACHIDNRGRVLPCSGLDIVVGDLRRQPLAEILRSSPVIRDLRHLEATVKGTCSECELKPGCYGCRAAAYQATGDYLAADPFCWRVCA